VFGVLALAYGRSVASGVPVENLRWAAVFVFITAAASDGVDGWIARRFDQCSELGAFLDPIADKALVLTAVVILTFVDWGAPGWSLPLWFTALVLARDAIILAGIRFLYHTKHRVAIRPHWSGKACTFSLFFVLGWMMLGPLPVPIDYTCAVAAVCVVWSALVYVREGLAILRQPPQTGS
jgi:CDP-diacylglycerol--glycerol-3-phosphate 3-phosphatidyltransferase